MAATRPLAEHLVEWREALLAKGNTERHAKLVVSRAASVIDGCGVRYWGELGASRVQTFITERGQNGLGVQSCNFYLQAIKQFCRWMVRDGRAPDSPLAHLSGRNVRTDRRHDRRALEPEELQRLLEAARTGPVRNGVPGPERAVLYQLSAETGFRVGELRTLTWGRVNLDGEQPTITIEAAYSKHRSDEQPLAASTMRILKLWQEIGGPCGAGDPVFRNLKRWTRTADMMKSDLLAAREAWLDEAATDQDRHDREASYFLRYEDQDGRVSGLTIIRHERQSAHSRDSHTQKTRSRFRSRGRFADSWKTASCWRSAKFSAATAARGRNNARSRKTITRTTPMAKPQFGICEAAS